MYIKKLVISNFKSFKGIQEPITFNMPNGRIGSGMNIFVGENNTGKSTIFESINFLRNGTKKLAEAIRNIDNPNKEASVEVFFEGEVDLVIENFSQNNKKAVFKGAIFGSDKKQAIGFSRNTANMKAVLLWNQESEEFENVTSIDGPVKKMFETNFVWSDTNPNAEAKFGSATLCGSLLKGIMAGFTESEIYQDFQRSFQSTFNGPDSELRNLLNAVELRIQNIVSAQFGGAKISFSFDEVGVDSFFKNTIINVDDGTLTTMQEKGSGMQRAVVLALIQVYAEELRKHPDQADVKKPFFLFIDEPEICLHPRAQEQLFSALLEISKEQQVFLTTHSPYFLATKSLKNIALFITKKEGNESVATKISGDNSLFPWSPTWGEINYKAFNMPTVDFHNELYGYLQEKSEKWGANQFEDWLVAKGVAKTKVWIRENKGIACTPKEATLQTWIRNKIHHPENVTMQAEEYSPEELVQSINEMIALLNRLA